MPFDAAACARDWELLAGDTAAHTGAIDARAFAVSIEHLGNLLAAIGGIRFAEADINEKRTDLLRHVVASGLASPTIQALVLAAAPPPAPAGARASTPPLGAARGAPPPPPPPLPAAICASRLLWLCEFTAAFIGELTAAEDTNLSRAARAAYSAALARHHSLPIRLLVKAATFLLPSRAAFLARIAASADTTSINSVARGPPPPIEETLKAFAQSVSAVAAPLRAFLDEKGLAD
jgi:hypothetical protein